MHLGRVKRSRYLIDQRHGRISVAVANDRIVIRLAERRARVYFRAEIAIRVCNVCSHFFTEDL